MCFYFRVRFVLFASVVVALSFFVVFTDEVSLIVRNRIVQVNLTHLFLLFVFLVL